MEEKFFWITNILMGLVLGAYAYIGRKFDDRLVKIEDRPACKYTEMRGNLDKLELRQDKLEPHILEIKVQLARIEEALVYLKEDKK
jgi:hypothetical protein